MASRVKEKESDAGVHAVDGEAAVSQWGSDNGAAGVRYIQVGGNNDRGAVIIDVGVVVETGFGAVSFDGFDGWLCRGLGSGRGMH